MVSLDGFTAGNSVKFRVAKSAKFSNLTQAPEDRAPALKAYVLESTPDILAQINESAGRLCWGRGGFRGLLSHFFFWMSSELPPLRGFAESKPEKNSTQSSARRFKTRRK
jgi:hypothetical protein